MRLCLLHLDDSLLLQEDFLNACRKQEAQELSAQTVGAHIRLWGKNNKLKTLSSALRGAFFSVKDGEPRLCFMGSGDFHHVTALLLDETLNKQSQPVTVIHFDNHPDWVHFDNGLHCGSWVNSAVNHPRIKKVITIGVCSNDLSHPERENVDLSMIENGKLVIFPYKNVPNRLSFTATLQEGEEAFLQKLLPLIQTEDIYITVDKDVLAHEDCVSNWDQGAMRLPHLVSLLQAIGQRHRIIGADVTGDYSRCKYAGTPWTRVLKYGERYLDQPRFPISEKVATNVNSRANHALLDVFSEVMS